MVVGGFLPFSAISVELYYIFATLWGREQYTLYGILFIVFVILLNVTACISIALTYFQLSSEDYRWWWRSLMCGGSTSIFVFGYAVLLLQEIQHVWNASVSTVFWIHTADMLCVLPDAQHSGFLCLLKVYKIHLCQPEDGLT